MFYFIIFVKTVFTALILIGYLFYFLGLFAAFILFFMMIS